MKIDYSDFLDHLITSFTHNDNKLQSHLTSSYYDFNLIDFIQYMLVNETESYNCYLNSIKHYYRLYNCKDIAGDDINTFIKLIDEFSEVNLIQILFFNGELINSLKNYLKCNPIKTLISIPYFKKALTESISPYIQDYNGIVFFDNQDKLPDLYINLITNNECNIPHINNNIRQTSDNNSIKYVRDINNHIQHITINQAFLNNMLNIFASQKLLPSEYKPLTVEIKNNIIKFSYSNIELNAMLVHIKDFDSILQSFSSCTTHEHAMILHSFLNEELPYDFVVLYFNDINKYIDMTTQKPLDWVITQFNTIKTNPYFERISKEYSISFAVFVHSIYPCGDVNEFLTDESKFKKVSYDRYSIFSFLSWMYNNKYSL